MPVRVRMLLTNRWRKVGVRVKCLYASVDVLGKTGTIWAVEGNQKYYIRWDEPSLNLTSRARSPWYGHATFEVLPEQPPDIQDLVNREEYADKYL